MSDRKLAQLQELLADLSPAELQQAAALIADKRADSSVGTVNQLQPDAATEQVEPEQEDAEQEDPWKTLERIGRELSAQIQPGGISMTEQLSLDRSARDWS